MAAHLGAEQVPQHPLMDTSGLGSASCPTRRGWQPVSCPTTWTCWYLRCQRGPGSETLMGSEPTDLNLPPAGPRFGVKPLAKATQVFLDKACAESIPQPNFLPLLLRLGPPVKTPN